MSGSWTPPTTSGIITDTIAMRAPDQMSQWFVCGTLVAMSVSSGGCGSIAAGGAVDSGSVEGRVPDARSTSDGGGHDATHDGAGASDDGGQDGRGDHELSLDSGTIDANLDDGPAAGAVACPTSMPEQSSSCAFEGQACSFGPNQCGCLNGGVKGSIWDCFACPTTPPASGGTCVGIAGQETHPYTCSYGRENCTCSLVGWRCETCPAGPPMNGTPCADFKGSCFYASPVPSNCSCSYGTDGGWSCILPCPSEAPTPGSSCEFAEGIACNYGSKSCSCDQKVAFCS